MELFVILLTTTRRHQGGLLPVQSPPHPDRLHLPWHDPPGGLAAQLPTLLQVAGVRPPPWLDGVSVWSSLSANLSSPRHTILHNIDQGEDTWQAAVSHRQYKLLWGQEYQLSRSQRAQADTTRLYNVHTDPGETDNIAAQNDKVWYKISPSGFHGKSLVKNQP